MKSLVSDKKNYCTSPASQSEAFLCDLEPHQSSQLMFCILAFLLPYSRVHSRLSYIIPKIWPKILSRISQKKL